MVSTLLEKYQSKWIISQSRDEHKKIFETTNQSSHGGYSIDMLVFGGVNPFFIAGQARLPKKNILKHPPCLYRGYHANPAARSTNIT